MKVGPSPDLGGRWTGLFNYPTSLPTTHFEAVLKDVGGLVSGLTTEDGANLDCSGIVHAVIEGRHDGHIVDFTKIYDEVRHAGSPIYYQGTIADGGDEISGTWEILGVWSGTFLMVRNPESQVSVERKVSEEIRR